MWLEAQGTLASLAKLGYRMERILWKMKGKCEKNWLTVMHIHTTSILGSFSWPFLFNQFFSHFSQFFIAFFIFFLCLSVLLTSTLSHLLLSVWSISRFDSPIFQLFKLSGGFFFRQTHSVDFSFCIPFLSPVLFIRPHISLWYFGVLLSWFYSRNSVINRCDEMKIIIKT